MSTLESATFLPQFGELTPRAAARWIAAALARAAALHEYDGWLYPADPAKVPAADQLHEAWRQWSDDADELLKKTQFIHKGNEELGGWEELYNAVGVAQAMIQLTPSEANRRRAQIERGDFYTLEDLRRELQLHNRR